MRRAVPRCWIETLETRSLMATIAVTTLADSGAGSLRAAVASAAANDTIDLSGLTGTITFASQITVSKNLELIGPGPDRLTLRGNNHATRAFQLSDSYRFSLSGLTLDGFGSTGYGGAISAQGNNSSNGTLSLADVVLSNNQAVSLGGAIDAVHYMLVMNRCTVRDNIASSNSNSAMGGGVSLQMGSLDLQNSTFAGNTVVGTAFNFYGNNRDIGFANGGGLAASAVESGKLVNCTFANNAVTALSGNTFPSDASAAGGGAYLRLKGVFSIDHCTFARNTVTGDVGSTHAGSAGGLAVDSYDLTSLTRLSLSNTLIASNVADTNSDAALGNGTSYSHNLLGNAAGTNISEVNGNLFGIPSRRLNARLGSLADNGGPTHTILLAANSPAINAANGAGDSNVDQRGYFRAGTPDIGAFEYQGLSPRLVRLTGGRLIAQGTAGADDIRLFSPKGRADTVRVTVGAGSWNFSRTAITAVEIYGDDGDDIIGITTNLNVFINGGRGNDAIAGGVGHDTIQGDEGSDRIDGGAGDDLLTGNAGSDRVNGGDGNDRVYGNAGNDRLNGDAGRDRQEAGDGRDILYAIDRSRDTVAGDAADAAYLDALDLRNGDFAVLA